MRFVAAAKISEVKAGNEELQNHDRWCVLEKYCCVCELCAETIKRYSKLEGLRLI